MTERPVEGKDELSRSLRQLREEAGLTTRDVAARTGFSQAKVSRVERGINVPTEADVLALIEVYEPPAGVARHLRALARDIRAVHRPVVMARPKARPSLFQSRLARIEASSEHVGTFSNTVVPGLLQTEAYIRELIAPRQLEAGEADNFVRARLDRQTLLDDTAHRFTLVIAEGVLGWRAGSREDMADQVERVADATRRENVRVGIIPWGTRATRFPLHAWDIYDRRAVSYGTVDATAILTEPRDVEKYAILFDTLASSAVYDDEARALLADIAHRYRRR
jgi:transcriptional regulator with XRE-family HTH domain